MATFTVGGTIVTFALLLDGAELAQQAAVSVEHIPGGNVNYIDTGGLEAPTFKCRARLDTFAVLTALRALLGVTGTLTYSEAVYTAVLRSVARTRAMGRGDVQFATLDFVLVT